MILLFNPPAPDGRGYTREGRCTQEAGAWGTQWPPLSLATAAALLRQEGKRVTIRDYPALGLDSRALVEDLWKLHPSFVVWTTGTPTLPYDIALARLVRENLPTAVTAVMGTHVTVRPQDALREEALDVVIRGEPEGVIAALCRSASPFSEVAGISRRGAEKGVLVHNPDAAPLRPEAIPAPAWGELDLDAYRLPLKGKRFLMVAPVRGCPYRCSFCTAPLYYGHHLRRRPVVDVVNEMTTNVQKFDVKEFFIWADTFTADRQYVQDFCRMILEKDLRVSWTCNSRVDTVDGETLELMKKAGLWMVSYGLESGNDAVLAASGKKITAAQSRAAVKLAHDLGIRTAGHFIFGLPGETEKSMAETLALALELPLDFAQFYSASPFPGTALYDEAMQKGWLSSSTFSQNNAVMELPGLSAAKVEAFRRYAYRRFYLRPRMAFRILSLLELSALTRLLPSFQRFIKWMR